MIGLQSNPNDDCLLTIELCNLLGFPKILEAV